MKKVFLLCLCVLLFVLTGCVSAVGDEKTGGIVSGGVFIDKIMLYKALPIARLTFGSDTSYALEVTTEAGAMIFSMLRPEAGMPFFSMMLPGYEESTTRQRGGFMVMASRGRLPFAPTYDFPFLNGVYYLFIGSDGDELTGVNISITGTGSGAEIEFLR